MSSYDMARISLMSAPAANTFSPPHTTTARTSRRPVASSATALSRSCVALSRAFIGGRSSRIVPTPLSTSRVTVMHASVRRTRPAPAHRGGPW